LVLRRLKPAATNILFLTMSEIIEKIRQLKKQKNAVILVHNYQLPEVQDIADYLGDSLDLSIKAKETDADVIVFCGVHFMAETAYVLSRKTVILPDITSGCPLANMITRDDVIKLRDKYPGVPIVGYINTSAEVKSEIDYCCTSANAVEVISKVPSDKVIFVPDKYLGSFVKRKVKNKEVVLYDGYCPTHLKILDDDIKKLKRKYPDAKVVVHPECSLAVQDIADEVCGTGGMIKYVRSHPEVKTFIIGTEVGMCYRLKKLFPEQEFIPASEHAICPNMKKNTLEKVLFSLKDGGPRIVLDSGIAERARRCLENMFGLMGR
jgi:quinolinate synthase